jgi:hypothetical protein
MHRYLLRALVAVLTFAIGVVLSLVPRLFTQDATTVANTRYAYSVRCRNRIRAPLLSIDNQPNEPLKLLYVATTVDPTDSQKIRVQFLVRNEGDQAVSGYSVRCKKGYSVNDASGETVLNWDSDSILTPGESQPIAFSCDAGQPLSLRVDTARFSDGSTWNNPRDAR